MASHDPIPIPLGYRGHCRSRSEVKQWLVKLTAVPYVLDSNPGESMDEGKPIVPASHWGIYINIRRAASHLERLIEREEIRNASD
ncbi:hypothetical protein TNCV_4192501 [Trichonephila clavipes]|nr:hypothetical protein TNCV_4192501 [Trichonephila clavipes]